MAKLNLLVAAGGTGGHLFPAMAVVEQLEEILGDDFKAYFVGSPDRMESRIVPNKGYEYFSINISGFAGASLKTLKLPFQIISAVNKVKKFIRKNDIHAVLCAGAYLSYPPGLAAKIVNRALFIMESNINPGKTINMLAPKADMIFTSFDESKKYFDIELHDKIQSLGNPIRKAIADMPERNQAAEKLGLDPQKITIFAFGGSLGAVSINKAIETNLDYFNRNDLQLIWQTGSNYSAPKSLPDNIKSLVFIDDMNTAYAASDLVMSRSGATTVAELCITGKPSILVPLASASNNEQEHNAKFLEKNNAAIMIKDTDISAKFVDIMDRIIRDRVKLAIMGQSAKALGRPDAARHTAEEIIKFMNL